MKQLCIILLTIFLLSLAACNQTIEEPDTQPTATEPGNTFVAKILDVYPSSYLIRPVAGEDERACAEKLIVAANPKINPKVGDCIKVFYDELSLNTSPALVQKTEIQLYEPQILDLPSLDKITQYSTEELLRELVGMTTADVIICWGPPNLTMAQNSVFTWYTDTSHKMKMSVSYHPTTNRVVSCYCVPQDEVEQMHTYVYQYGSNEFVIKLWSGGTFMYTDGIINHIYVGTWTKDTSDVLCLKEQMINGSPWNTVSRINYFQMLNGNLIWVQKNSDGFAMIDLANGTTFTNVR